jgi:hypothetical protein
MALDNNNLLQEFGPILSPWHCQQEKHERETATLGICAPAFNWRQVHNKIQNGDG